ncbi:MAG TPA: DUF881 domain-containing protein [Nocardioides sp.]|uniref:DUF881 domain-containing protein n=1 Tax=Nocardioides sp. TaxID=35761 RepID=UPI002BE536A9|nr:DUF881 domain-containing protein [Nocardioides sp.]HQR26801.1 DUF881 domain-containing protein [Nocardioides sp.]
MTHQADPHPEDRAPAHGHLRQRSRWRLATPVAFGLCGVLFVASAHNSDGTDLRPERYTDLASLVSNEARQVKSLHSQVRDLNREVEELAGSVKGEDVSALQQKGDALRGPAGLTPVTGPGVTVTLSDAPEEVINSSTGNLNLLVVHQQDIQAVVNAMWRGGAEAVTVQGQRIVSTTGIKCEGNAVQLDGVPYAQPYVIAGIGDQAALLQAIDDDPYLAVYREQANQPTIAVGWEIETPSSITAPGYSGLTNLSHASVIRP